MVQLPSDVSHGKNLDEIFPTPLFVFALGIAPHYVIPFWEKFVSEFRASTFCLQWHGVIYTV